MSHRQRPINILKIFVLSSNNNYILKCSRIFLEFFSNYFYIFFSSYKFLILTTYISICVSAANVLCSFVLCFFLLLEEKSALRSAHAFVLIHALFSSFIFCLPFSPFATMLVTALKFLARKTPSVDN